MNVSSTLIWGLASTVVLSILLLLCRSMHLTRMDVPFLLGTMFTSDRHRAKVIGFFMHLVMGWLFAFIYIWAMEDSGHKVWWFGGLIGFVHASFVLTVGMSIVAIIHPRMATEDQGPEPTKQLEPPGFLILNYGRGTPTATYLVHIIYGIILGAFYSS